GGEWEIVRSEAETERSRGTSEAVQKRNRWSLRVSRTKGHRARGATFPQSRRTFKKMMVARPVALIPHASAVTTARGCFAPALPRTQVLGYSRRSLRDRDEAMRSSFYATPRAGAVGSATRKAELQNPA